MLVVEEQTDLWLAAEVGFHEITLMREKAIGGVHILWRSKTFSGISAPSE
jgi:hypothetical protein